MGRSWGQCDFEALLKLSEQIAKYSSLDGDQLCRRAAKQLAQILLNKVKKRTPVGKPPKFDEPKTMKVLGEDYTVQITNKNGEKVFRKRKGKMHTILTRSGAIHSQYWAGYRGGTLRDGWTILPIQKQGDAYTITVINNLEYASYVEFGHRQQPGRYVPALGKRLRESWVPGRYMLTISEQELRALAPRLLQDLLYDAMREVFT